MDPDPKKAFRIHKTNFDKWHGLKTQDTVPRRARDVNGRKCEHKKLNSNLPVPDQTTKMTRSKTEKPSIA
jgi:hypothetical protein